MKKLAYCSRIAVLVLAVAGIVFVPASALAKKVQLTMRPMIFVHGYTGSAQQYEWQAMRFASNGNRTMVPRLATAAGEVSLTDKLDYEALAVRAELQAKSARAIHMAAYWREMATTYRELAVYSGAAKSSAAYASAPMLNTQNAAP